MEDQNKFVYSALPKDHIRLLEFSVSDSDELVCGMTSFPLDEALRFYALSYTWGTGLATEAILCNGLRMNITTNLNEAIRTLYSPPHSLSLQIWIDAICINQENEEEKSGQVSLMGDIYRSANEVVVWLGPSGQDSDVAMEWLERLSVALPRIQPGHISVVSLNGLGLPDGNSPLWPALGSLYRRKWFGRLWTFQEAVLAPNIIVVCGRNNVVWEVLSSVAFELIRLRLTGFCNRGEAFELHEDGYIAILDVVEKRSGFGESKELHMPDLLLIADTKLCTVPRDRVFAMLGMVSKSFRDRILISYSSQETQGELEAYMDCAKACIEECLPTILDLVAGRPRLPGLPTWCPNIRSNPRCMVPFSRHFRASDIREEGPSFQAKVLYESSNLAITGFRIDRVTEVIEETISWLSVSQDQLSYLTQMFTEWESRCLKLAQKTIPFSPGTVHMAHVCTLAAYTRARVLAEGDKILVQAYLDLLANYTSLAKKGAPFHPPSERVAALDELSNSITVSCNGRRYFSTEGGRLGLGPPDTQVGDTVCVFYGTRPLFVLREAEKEPEKWELVGDAFVYDLMELSETLARENVVDEVFTIV